MTVGTRSTTTLFHDLFEFAPDALICADSSGRIEIVNAETVRLFGYPREELVGQPVEVLLPALGLLPALEGIPSSSEPSLSMAVPATKKDGSTFAAEVTLAVLETDRGRVLDISVRDQTARQEAEAEKQQFERKALRHECMESLGRLAGGVAHDFNNHLGVIGTYVHFVTTEVTRAEAGDLDRPWASIRQDLSEIRETTACATQLSRRLLDFARPGSVRPSALRLNEVVTTTEPALRRSLGPDVALVTKLPGDLWHIVADPNQIERVLTIVAENARDAMSDGGTVTIEATNLDVDEQIVLDRPELVPGRYVCLRVSDTGAGMTDETARRAFEPYFSTKPSAQGTGLGLATVWGIITQADGQVHLSSPPGSGTTFTALLPAVDAAFQTDDRPTDDRPTDDRPTDDRPTDDRPTDDRPTDDRPTDCGEDDGRGGP
jgi:hypothetical protein